MFSRRSDCSTMRSRSFLVSLPFLSMALRKVDRRIAAAGWLLTASSASFSLALAPISSFCSGIVFRPCALPGVPLIVTVRHASTWQSRVSLGTPKHSRCSDLWLTDTLNDVHPRTIGQETVLHSHLRFFEVFPPAAFLGFGLAAGLPPGLFPPPVEPPPGGSRLK